MVTEHAVIAVKPGSEAAFERALEGAPDLFSRASGFRSFRAGRAVEDGGRYVVVIEWETLEDHTVRFRESGLDEWRALVGEHFAGKPEVHHYETVKAFGTPA